MMQHKYLFGTTSGDVVFVFAETRVEAWEKAISDGWYRDELRYHGWVKSHAEKVPEHGDVHSTK
jgi:hypothetical protein